MKQAAIKKRIFVCTFAAVVLLIVFAVLGIQPIRRQANAYDGTFYFRGDPQISTKAISRRFRIRFNLIVSENVLGANDSVTVTLTSNSTGSFLQRAHDGTTLTDSDEEGQTQSVSFAKSVMTFEGGTASLYIDMYLNVYERGRITATCSGSSAVSEEYTVVSAIKILLDEGKAPYSLAKIYDQYVGKDPTNETHALSMISNVVPYYYNSTGDYIAEIEVPEALQTMMKNPTFDYKAVFGDIKRRSGFYYAISATIATVDPATQSSNALNTSGVVSRRFYYLNKGFYQWAKGGSSFFAYIPGSYSNFCGNVYSAQFLSITNGRATIQFRNNGANSTRKLYFYVELLEYFHEETNSEKTENNNTNISAISQSDKVTSLYRSNAQASSLQDIAKQILKNNSSLSDTERSNICSSVGLSTIAEKPLEVIYKTYSTAGNYETKSQVYSIASIAVYNKFSAIHAMYNLSEIKNLAGFNIVSRRRTYDSESGQVLNAGDKILRQALGYDYVYNETEEKGYLTVLYDEFRYKDFSITIKNNEVSNALEMNYFTANVREENGIVTLTYNYSDIEERLLNSCGWLFDLSKDDFSVTGGSDALVGVSVGDDALSVRIPVKYQSDLFGLNVTAVAKIVPDEDYQLKYVYYGGFEVSSNGRKIDPDIAESAGTTVKLSKLKRYNDYSNFMAGYQSEIVAPLEAFERQYGVKFAQPENISMSTDSNNKICKITIGYQKHALFLVTDNLTNEWHYMQVRHTSNVYTGDEFVNARGGEVDGYRVDKLNSGTSALKITNNYQYAKAKAVLNADTYSGDIYPVNVIFTDKWLIEINYMNQYKQTPFAEKTKYSGEIRVKDYPDIYALKSADLATILGLKSMSIIRDRSTVDEIAVSYDGIGKYTVNTTYTPLSMVQRDSSGKQQNEVCVPLSCYKEWCEDYGKDWTILYLNYAGNVYFRYSNDVKPENLYGFFSVAIFDNKVSDLNDVFSSFDSTGCKTFHSEEEVRGSRIYKFFRSDEGKLATVLSFATAGLISGKLFTCTVVGVALRRIALAFCESPLSDSDNAVYTSRFFFLDGTSDTPIMADNGSTDPGNTNGAAANAALGVIDDVKEFFLSLKDKVFNSTYAKIIAVGFGIVLIVLIFVLIIRLIRFAFSGGGKRRR